MSAPHAHDFRVKKRASDSLRMELQLLVSRLWVLEQNLAYLEEQRVLLNIRLTVSPSPNNPF